MTCRRSSWSSTTPAAPIDDVGAFVTTTHDLARDHARRLTETGRPTDAGPLWGVPTGIKDLHPTAGVRTTFGSAAYDDFVPDESDDLVLTVEAAGMPSLGKTNTPEFGSPCYTEPDVAPPAVTPWDTTRTAGGSSGRRGRGRRGRAAAGRAGLRRRRLDPDPRLCCGLVGLKPSRGRISGAPRYGDPVGLATPGTLARTVRDAAALLDVLAGRRVGDPFWAPPPTDVVPRRLRPRARAGCASPASSRPSSPTSTSTRPASPPGRTPHACSSSSATTSRTSRSRSRPTRSPTSRPAGPCSPRCRRRRPAARTGSAR